jgi:hypothetical protein
MLCTAAVDRFIDLLGADRFTDLFLALGFNSDERLKAEVFIVTGVQTRLKRENIVKK